MAEVTEVVIRRVPCLSDSALESLREELLEAETGKSMVIHWDYAYKALDEIKRLRAENEDLKLTISGKTFFDPTDARVVLLEAEKQALREDNAELLAHADAHAFVVGNLNAMVRERDQTLDRVRSYASGLVKRKDELEIAVQALLNAHIGGGDGHARVRADAFHALVQVAFGGQKTARAPPAPASDNEATENSPREPGPTGRDS